MKTGCSTRKKNNALNAPWSVYEVHLASWMRPEKNNEKRIQHLRADQRKAGALCKSNGLYTCGVHACNGTSL